MTPEKTKELLAAERTANEFAEDLIATIRRAQAGGKALISTMIAKDVPDTVADGYIDGVATSLADPQNSINVAKAEIEASNTYVKQQTDAL